MTYETMKLSEKSLERTIGLLFDADLARTNPRIQLERGRIVWVPERNAFQGWTILDTLLRGRP